MIARLRCGLLLALALEAAPALAFDPFEIQVYDGSIDERHQAGLELHVNRPRDGPLHLTLEPSFGLTDFWELGGYFQTADGRYEGVKLRTKLALPLGRFRAGVNFELKLPSTHFRREVGLWAGVPTTPEGRPIPQAEFDAKKHEWIPSAEDQRFVKSLMQRVTEPGKMAAWIAPPDRGINAQPVDYEYVKL